MCNIEYYVLKFITYMLAFDVFFAYITETLKNSETLVNKRNTHGTYK